MEHQPKTNIVEIFLVMSVTIIADLISLIPGVNWVVSAIMFPGSQFYFWTRGLRSSYALMGNLVEFIPFISILPAYTAMYAVTFYIDHYPESRLAKATAKIPSAKKPLAGMASIKTPVGGIKKAA